MRVDRFRLDASIIIPSHNDRRWLEISLPSLLQQDFKGTWEIIIVNNASTDDTAEYVSKNYPQVKILNLTRNLSYAGGCNEGARHATGEYLIILNDDVTVANDWLSQLYKAAKENPEYKLLVSVDQLALKRDFNTYLEVIAIPGSSNQRIVPSVFASGACFLVPRKWLDSIGTLFEPCFYYEDAELSIRTILAGGKIGYVTTSRFQHFSSIEYGIRTKSEAGQKSLNLARFGTKHKIITISTHFKITNTIKLLIVHHIYVILRCLTKRQEVFKNTAMIRGTFEGVCSLGISLGRRRRFSKIKKRGDEYLFERLYVSRNSMAQRAMQGFLSRKGQ